MNENLSNEVIQTVLDIRCQDLVSLIMYVEDFIIYSAEEENAKEVLICMKNLRYIKKRLKAIGGDNETQA